MFYILKIKDRDLFFNADEMIGEYICNIPMLLDLETKNSIVKYCPDKIFSLYNDEEFSKDDLEIKEVELKYI